MNITQTKHFKLDLEHTTKLCNEYKHITQKIEVVQRHIDKIKKYRGVEYTQTLCKKVNQKCKYKHFIVSGDDIQVIK